MAIVLFTLLFASSILQLPASPAEARLLGRQQKPADGFKLRLTRRHFHANQSFESDDGGNGLRVRPDVEMAIRRGALRIAHLTAVIDANTGKGKGKVYHPDDASFGTGSCDCYHGTEGEYMVEIQLGTPPQPVYLVMDTAGRWVWTWQAESVYIPDESSTYSQFNCESQECQDLHGDCGGDDPTICHYDRSNEEMWAIENQGIYSMDVVTMQTLNDSDSDFSGLTPQTVPLRFGYSTAVNQEIDVSGVMGLGLTGNSFMSQVGHALGYTAFAHCFSSWQASEAQDPATSTFVIGRWRPQGVTAATLVTNDAHPTAYYLPLQSILVNGQALDVPSGVFDIDSSSGYGGFFIDSSLPFTHFVSGAFQPLMDWIAAHFTFPTAQVDRFQLCYDTSQAGGNVEYPDIALQFANGAVMEIPTANIVIAPVQGQSSTICFAFRQHDHYNILGNYQQQNVLMQYDVQNKQVGWNGPVTDCGSPGD